MELNYGINIKIGGFVLRKVIVIEGLDGSGKETQAGKLALNLLNMGYTLVKKSFPNYKSESSKLVQMYLDGEISKELDDINIYGASILYSADRYITFKREIEATRDSNSILVLDRYTTANIIHQGAKIECDQEREEYYDWLTDLEQNKMGLPQQLITIYLDLPIWKSQELMEKRYGGDQNKKDLHESNKDYFKGKGQNWQLINCLSEDGDIREIDDIAEEVLSQVLKVIDN